MHLKHPNSVIRPEKFQSGPSNLVTANFHMFGFSAERASNDAVSGLYIDKDTANAFYDRLKESDIQEALLIKTCNRLEVFYFAGEEKNAEIAKLFAELAGNEAGPLPEAAVKSGMAAIRYYLESAVGLHSKVTGDSGIFAQFQEASSQLQAMHFTRLNAKVKHISSKVHAFANETFGETHNNRGFIAPAESNQIIKDFDTSALNRPANILVVGTRKVAIDALDEIKNSKNPFIAQANVAVASRRQESIDKFRAGRPNVKEGILYTDTLAPETVAKFDLVIIATKGKPHSLFSMPAVEALNPDTNVEDVTASGLVQGTGKNHRAINGIQGALHQREEVQQLHSIKGDVGKLVDDFVKEEFYPVQHKVSKLAVRFPRPCQAVPFMVRLLDEKDPNSTLGRTARGLFS